MAGREYGGFYIEELLVNLEAMLMQQVMFDMLMRYQFTSCSWYT
jgi:hypothetical protein